MSTLDWTTYDTWKGRNPREYEHATQEQPKPGGRCRACGGIKPYATHPGTCSCRLVDPKTGAFR